MLIYVAVLRDTKLTSDDVLCVQTSFDKLEIYVKNWFGINEAKNYSKPAECLGYTKFEYSEFEDDLDGFFTFKEDDEITKVYVFNKILDEKPC